jgi:addiction module RelE/StbE family toxin
VIKLVWHQSFIRAFKKTIKKNPEIRDKLRQALELFVNNPYHPILGTHKLSGKLKGHHAFTLGYDCRVVVKFIEPEEVALISIGKHDEVY